MARPRLNLSDNEMVRLLEARDGPIASRRRSHLSGDEDCPHKQIYALNECPWCEAQRRREELTWNRRRVA